MLAVEVRGLVMMSLEARLVIRWISTNVFFSAPRGPPLNITAQNTSSTTLYATWKPIAENLRFGIVLGYRINFIKQTEAAFRRKRRSIVSPESVLVENEPS